MRDETMEFFERLKAHTGGRQSPRWDLPLVEPDDTALPVGFEIGRALRTAQDEISACAGKLLSNVGTPLSDQIQTLADDLERLTTRIAVVGQIKAGKSSFINALTGRSGFLPTHVNPWTAVPTELYFGVPEKPRNGAVFEFFNQKEWSRLGQTLTGSIVDDATREEQDGSMSSTARMVWRRALMRIGERYHHLLGQRHRYQSVTPDVLSHYLCVGPSIDQPTRKMHAGRYADITRLAHVYLPSGPFICPTVLIDTPGLNDPTFIRVKTTQTILEYADAYIVILTATQPLSFTDIALLRQLRGLEKRRFLVFINRIDELSGGRDDVLTVETHVRSRLRQEFPGAAVSVISGSALWANAANGGGDAELSQIVASPAFRAMIGDTTLPGDMTALRALVFAASGMPGLGRALSDLMLDSFLASEGAIAINLLKSAAEVTASAARLELKTLRELTSQNKPSRKGGAVQAGIAQLEKRLNGLGVARERIDVLILGARDKIGSICQEQCASIRASVETGIDAFAARERRQLAARGNGLANVPWSCDATALLKQLETDFLDRFSTAMKDIAAVHDDCLDQVRGFLETPHAATGAARGVRKATPPDLRRALPALSETININVSQPWWQRWWGTARKAQDSGLELEMQIKSVFAPVGERLVALAAHELAISGEEARVSLERTASSALTSTSARLQDLRQRLMHYDKQERGQQSEMVGKDYEKGMKALFHVISQCEAITTRLSAIGSGIRRDA